jgi:hypothetical protein
MPSYFVEPWQYAYQSPSGRIKTLCLNLWSYDGTHITKIGEYIDWPFANDEDPNYWAKTSSVIKKPIVSDGKYYKSERYFNSGLVLEPLDQYPDANSSFEQKGIVEAH